MAHSALHHDIRSELAKSGAETRAAECKSESTAHLREATLHERRSFTVEDFVADTELLESARNAGYATKVIFMSTEDPNLNVKVTHSSPEWLKDVFGRELRAEGKQQERPARRR